MPVNLTAPKTLIDSLHTGDIVLFSGKSGTSTGIKWMTMSNWSHAGLVVREGAGAPLLWESTTLDDLRDRATGTFRQGVQLVSLAERVANYDGEVIARRLQGVSFSKEDLKRFAQLRKTLKGRPYEISTVETLKAAYDGPGGHNEENLTSLFCSELVAEAYQSLGLLSEAQRSNEYIPTDFSVKHYNLTVLRGRLGEELVLKAA